MSADPVLEEFPLEAMEEIDVVAKEWIQEQSDKEVVNKYTCVVQSKKKKNWLVEILETYQRCWLKRFTT